jgi:hypothetical protein
MPKANLSVLPSQRGQKAECSVCSEKFHVSHDSKDSKADKLKQFAVHLYRSHHQQRDAQKRKNTKREAFPRR